MAIDPTSAAPSTGGNTSGKGGRERRERVRELAVDLWECGSAGAWCRGGRLRDRHFDLDHGAGAAGIGLAAAAAGATAVAH